MQLFSPFLFLSKHKPSTDPGQQNEKQNRCVMDFDAFKDALKTKIKTEVREFKREAQNFSH